jgi:hypothetical protein
MDIVYVLLGDEFNLTPIAAMLDSPVVDSPGSSAESTTSDVAIRYEIDLEPADENGKTPLTYAKEKGYMEIATLITTAIRKRNK